MGSQTPCALVVMGVSGSGKSTISERLAARLGWGYEDGDRFHPASNVAKMSAGHPLTDEDRWPWLQAIADEIDRLAAARERAVKIGERNGDHAQVLEGLSERDTVVIYPADTLTDRMKVNVRR